jgi:hypothetical protein
MLDNILPMSARPRSTMSFAPWLRRHPLLAYCAAVYGISWGGILVVAGARGLIWLICAQWTPASSS